MKSFSSPFDLTISAEATVTQFEFQIRRVHFSILVFFLFAIHFNAQLSTQLTFESKSWSNGARETLRAGDVESSPAEKLSAIAFSTRLDPKCQHKRLRLWKIRELFRVALSAIRLAGFKIKLFIDCLHSITFFSRDETLTSIHLRPRLERNYDRYGFVATGPPLVCSWKREKKFFFFLVV
jgi:hypothetical protein